MMKDLLKLIVCWLAYIVSLILTGIVTVVFHLPIGHRPPNGSVGTHFLTQCLAGVLLVIGLYAQARRTWAPAPLRALAFSGFLLLALGVNGLIEAVTFTNYFEAGLGGAVAFYVLLAIGVGTALGLLFGSNGKPTGFRHRSWLGWTLGVAAAWLAWPVIYTFFGMCIAPIVLPYYRAGIAGLRIPPTMEVLIQTQMIRSVFFLAASLPFVALWKGSRRGLWLALGLAHTFTVGIYGLAAASFFPAILRVTHSIEITCDSFAYAGLLVLLFCAPAISATDTAPMLKKPELGTV